MCFALQAQETGYRQPLFTTIPSDWPMELSRSPLTPLQRAVLTRIQGLMEYWQIKPEELDGTPMPPPRPAPLLPAARVKYRHPVSGDTWDGLGEQPAWLRQALLQQGYLVSELRTADADADTDADPNE